MEAKFLKNITRYLVCMVALLQISAISLAQESATQLEEVASELQINQLDELVESLTIKQDTRDAVREKFKAASSDDQPGIQEEIDELNAELKETRLAIEQIAVGSALLKESSVEFSEFNWRTELNDVFMPLVQNLKRITEKPRKIEVLRTKINYSGTQLLNAEAAVNNITMALENSLATKPETVQTLTELQTGWLSEVQDLQRDINLATIQLENVQRNDTPILVSIRNSLMSFFKGRGLTLLLAAGAAITIYFGTKLIARLYAKRQKGENAHEFRTRQRIIHYALKAVKTLLIFIVIILVFYFRGDILLLSITFLIAAGVVLSLRNTVPRFLNELRLLLNIGPIREDERVMYQGLPWKVTQLNMYSILKNPEITGIHRIPIAEMANLTSRPAGKEPWFPASKDDYILLEDERVVQVAKLTPEHVLIQTPAGTQTMLPTTDFYHMVFQNLTRSSSVNVASGFGVDYAHQSDSVTLIPQKFREAIQKELSTRLFSENVINVHVELQEAGTSSLDYWIGVKMNSDAAVSYWQIKWLIQQVCVTTCTREDWGIPFPQLTLHGPTDTSTAIAG